NAGAQVEVDGRPVLSVYANIGGFTAQERANAIQDRIVSLAKRADISANDIKSEDRGTWSEILARGERVMAITEADARGAERNRPELAAEDVELIRQTIVRYRADHTWGHLLWAIAYAILATAVFLGILGSAFLIRRQARSRIERWLGRETDR